MGTGKISELSRLLVIKPEPNAEKPGFKHILGSPFVAFGNLLGLRGGCQASACIQFSPLWGSGKTYEICLA
jgi:hypothetical protein